MFTWICPQCGREVPPAYNDCPDCAAKTAAGAPPADTAAAPPPQAAQPAPPVAAIPAPEPPPAYRQEHATSPMFQPAPAPPPPQYLPLQRGGGVHLPTWLLTLLFAIAFLAIGGGIYWFANRNKTPQPTAIVESPAAKPGASTNPLQKVIEVTGVRFSKMAKGVAVTFVLVNHSDQDVVGLAGNATIWGRTQRSEEDAVGTVAFQTSLAAQKSVELTLPFTTKVKLQDMPTWQNLTVDVQITAPSGA